MFLHVLEHTLEDTLRMLPFLYLAYLFIEYIERRQGQRISLGLITCTNSVFTFCGKRSWFSKRGPTASRSRLSTSST